MEKNMKRKWSRLTTIIILLQFLLSHSVVAETQYIWSVVPQFTGTAVHRDWTPVLKHIESKTGYRFKLKIYDSIPEFEKGFINGVPDFAYMNPYHAVMAKDAQGYSPIVRNSKRLLSGIMVVRQDSAINNIKHLNGKKIAFPSPNAFAASLYMRALLREKEGIDFIPVYAGTHSNAYRLTLAGKTIATGAVKRTLLKERKELQQNLKILYKTPGFPSHPLTVHKRVPDKVKKAVQSTLLELAQTPHGEKLLKAILLSHPTKANYDTDYLPLKKLELDKYLVRR
jgi:phosphonate transport system substrate-binding protein